MLAAQDIPSLRARTGSGSDPDEACARNMSAVSLRRRSEDALTHLRCSRSVAPATSLRRGRSVRASPRGSGRTLACARWLRTRCVQSISALRNISNSSTLASPFPSAAIRSRTPFGVLSRMSHSCRTSRFVPVHARRLFSRSSLAHPKAREGGSRQLGAARCKRGWGASRFTTRHPLRRPRRALREGRYFPLGMPSRPPLTPLSPPLEWRGAAVATSTPWPRGRQDRFRGYLVKGARFPDPRCLPSLARPHDPPAPKCERTRDI
jgi:hypothetical protein